MRLRQANMVAAMVGLVAAPVLAQNRSPQVEALDAQLPGTIINDPTTLAWQPQGKDLRIQSVKGNDVPGGGAAARYTVPRAGAHLYDIGVNVPLPGAIAKADVVTVGFWARTVSAETADGNAVVGVRVQRNEDPWPGFGDTRLTIGRQWKWYEASAMSNIDVPAGKGVVSLQLAGSKQVVEIGQAIVVKGAGSIQPQAGSAGAIALEVPPALAGNGTLLNQPQSRNWGYAGPGSSHADLADKSIYMAQATRFTSPSVGANRWDISANVPISGTIKTGDVLLIALAVKTVSAATEDGKALIGIRVQDNSASDYPGFADNQFKAGPNWQLIQLRTTATRDIAPGSAVVALHFAGAQQVVDVGPVYVLKVN